MEAPCGYTWMPENRARIRKGGEGFINCFFSLQNNALGGYL